MSLQPPQNKNDFSNWKIEIETRFGDNGIMPSQNPTNPKDPITDINFDIIYKMKDHEMGDARYDGQGNEVISNSNTSDHLNQPNYTVPGITYHITAISIRQVYRVERKLFSGWDHSNKQRTTLPPNSKDVIKTGKLLKSQSGSTETINLKE